MGSCAPDRRCAGAGAGTLDDEGGPEVGGPEVGAVEFGQGDPGAATASEAADWAGRPGWERRRRGDMVEPSSEVTPRWSSLPGHRQR
ncbi:hypothetical protein CG736_01025 [Kitasatospora sp. CB02891]|nr:hypothetical protein CG736_01025 [Kitasatospora sp. CB02891]